MRAAAAGGARSSAPQDAGCGQPCVHPFPDDARRPQPNRRGRVSRGIDCGRSRSTTSQRRTFAARRLYAKPLPRADRLRRANAVVVDDPTTGAAWASTLATLSRHRRSHATGALDALTRPALSTLTRPALSTLSRNQRSRRSHATGALDALTQPALSALSRSRRSRRSRCRPFPILPRAALPAHPPGSQQRFVESVGPRRPIARISKARALPFARHDRC